MNQITRRVIRQRCREKTFLFFSYVANITIICILTMIATGIKDITNESLSSSDLQQMKNILSSMIFVSVLAIMFFQWIISMQFKALFLSRKQFNNNLRLMGVPNLGLFKIYIREMFTMQPFTLLGGGMTAEIIYYLLSGMFRSGQRYIGLRQLVFSTGIHLASVSVSIFLTYRRLVKGCVVDAIRMTQSSQAIPKLGRGKTAGLIAGGLLLVLSVSAAMTAEQGGDVQSYGYFGILTAIFILFDPLILLFHQAALRISKKHGWRSMIFSESITLGYLQKSSIVCSMILFSTMMFLGLQMLYRNVRAAGGDIVDARVHYAGTILYDEMQNAADDTLNRAYGLKYRCPHGETIWHITGIDGQFSPEYETLIIDDSFAPLSGEINKNLNSSVWDGIIMPNMYLQRSDIGKEIRLVLEGKEVVFHVAGACYSNNFAHQTFYVSRSYLQAQLGYAPESHNMIYVKDRQDLEQLTDVPAAVQTREEIKAESYEKAVSGTALVEMVSLIIVFAAALSLINFIMLSSGEDNRDIARLRGLGVPRKNINKIYGIESLVSVFWASAAAIPASVYFAKIGCTMVFDAKYYLRPFITAPGLMIILTIVFMGISYCVRRAAIYRMAETRSYIDVLRDINS